MLPVLYDKATTDDGNAADNGNVSPVSVKVLSAPGGASWVKFVRMNGLSPVVSARHIAGDDTVGSLAALTQSVPEPDAAVDPSGRLVMALPSGAQARAVLVRVDTNGASAPRSRSGPPMVRGLGEHPCDRHRRCRIATVGWRLDVFASSERDLEARRVDTTTTPMTPLGAGAAPMNDDLPQFYIQYGPLFGVDPAGAVVIGWSRRTPTRTTRRDGPRAR